MCTLILFIHQRAHNVVIETYPVTTVTTESNLVLHNVSDAHTGNYMCREP